MAALFKPGSWSRAQISFMRLVKRVALKRSPSAIDLSDPIRNALHDAEILIAFAAQSYRRLEAAKVTRLNDAAHRVRSLRQAGADLPADVSSEFWIAYDAIALDMAPLSAHSIKSSMYVNCQRFPRSLFTPTGFNAALAVIVFLLCLALQSFWVAGKDLIDRAEAIEVLRAETQKRLDQHRNTLDPLVAKLNSLDQQLEQEKRAPLQGVVAQIGLTAPPGSIKATELQSKLEALSEDLAVKQSMYQEISTELDRILERSGPLNSLLEGWYKQASAVCSREYLRLLICPFNSAFDLQEFNSLRNKVKSLRNEAEAARRSASRASSYVQMETPVYGGMYSRGYVDRWTDRDLREKEEELNKMQSDRFRSLLVEVRIIVANLAAYLIAMVMGVLGSLAYVLRTLSTQLRDHTYVPLPFSVSIVRICLGAIAGVFGSMLGSGDPTLKTLPPVFIPFVLGYGIEILFSLLDRIVKTFTQAEMGTPSAARMASRSTDVRSTQV